MRHTSGTIAVLALLLPCVLSACATSGEAVSERLDPNTATTVIILSRPIELFSQSGHGAAVDPFAYLAPFETDRQGTRQLYLWVSAPQNEGLRGEPEILCNGQPVSLQAVRNGEPGLSAPPYESPVPWSQQWYFRLSEASLKCLAGAQGITLQTQHVNGETEVYTVERKSLAALDAFTQHY